MNFSIVFQPSGDSIPFVTINSQAADVLTYYVDNLNNRSLNKFSSLCGSEIQKNIDVLHQTIVDCNKFVYELLDQHIDTCKSDGYLEQKNLNRLHADWVRSQKMPYNIAEKRRHYQSSQAEQIHDMFPDSIPEPQIGEVILRLGVGELYGKINHALHSLESSLSIMKFSTSEWIEIENIFSKSLLTGDVCNFSLNFNHLGRTLYNKFINFDHDLEFDDENSFNELLGFVEIKLVPPQTKPLSNEYVAWCQQHNRTPIGDHLNIGDIINLNENLTKYRKIIFKNTLKKNTFSIQLNKGT
jgi:hypothetical protein